MPQFTPNLLQFTLPFLNLPQFTSIYINLHQITLIYLGLPMYGVPIRWWQSCLMWEMANLQFIPVESLEFLEILRLLKFYNFITMVRRNLGSATPPSVMALFINVLAITSLLGGSSVRLH